MRIVALVALAVATPVVAAAEPIIHVAVDAPELDSTAKTRHEHAMRDALAQAAPSAQRLDVAIAKLDVDVVGDNVEVCERVRVVVSDARGKMLAIVSAGATVRVPRRQFRANKLDAIRADALADAARRLAESLRAGTRAPTS